MGPIGSFETSVSNHLTLLNNPEDKLFQAQERKERTMTGLMLTERLALTEGKRQSV